jgi:hypothetical protein
MTRIACTVPAIETCGLPSTKQRAQAAIRLQQSLYPFDQTMGWASLMNKGAVERCMYIIIRPWHHAAEERSMWRPSSLIDPSRRSFGFETDLLTGGTNESRGGWGSTCVTCAMCESRTGPNGRATGRAHLLTEEGTQYETPSVRGFIDVHPADHRGARTLAAGVMDDSDGTRT